MKAIKILYLMAFYATSIALYSQEAVPSVSFDTESREFIFELKNSTDSTMTIFSEVPSLGGSNITCYLYDSNNKELIRLDSGLKDFGMIENNRNIKIDPNETFRRVLNYSYLNSMYENGIYFKFDVQFIYITKNRKLSRFIKEYKYNLK